MVDKLNLYRKQLQGYHYSRQLLFGLFDMKVHSKEFIESGETATNLFNSMQKEILGLDFIPNTSEVASFGHLMGGYDAGYYGYAWSLVYAKDLFSNFKNNLLDSNMGMKLRTEVLSQGALRDSMESIRLFLGREPSNEAFIESITIQ
jgi:Zn-dependent oligopeptidase